MTWKIVRASEVLDQRDRVSLLIKFGFKKKKKKLFKKNDEFEFKLDLSEKQSFTHC